jgi:hypothetical protein
VALATGILFGVVPAFVSTSEPPMRCAKAAVRRRPRLHRGAQRARRRRSGAVARAAVRRGLLLRSFVKLQNIDLGYRAERVLTAGVQLPGVQYNPAQSTDFFRDALSRVVRAARSAQRGRRLVPAAAGLVHRHEHVARGSAKPADGSCVPVRSGRSRRVLQDDGELRCWRP